MGQLLNFGMQISKLSHSFFDFFFLILCILLKVLIFVLVTCSFGLVRSYDMPCNIESASLEPKSGNKFVAGGEDMWVRLFDFHTGDEIGE